MKPLINGRVFVVIKKHAYDSIQQRQLLVYLGRPDARSTERQSLLHRAVLRDRGGWLMSGDNNARSESWDRVAPRPTSAPSRRCSRSRRAEGGRVKGHCPGRAQRFA